MAPKWHCANPETRKRLCGIDPTKGAALDLPHFNMAACINNRSKLCQKCLKLYEAGKEP
jgi:hypothetical protein